MDEERIQRIARAMCRAARLDPDKPVEIERIPSMAMSQLTEKQEPQPAWKLFLHQAEYFAVTHHHAPKLL